MTEIPKGYKHTEVGVIPEEWEVKPLSQLSHFQNGKAHEQFIDEYGDYIVVNSKFISTGGEVKKYSKQNISPLQKGDITIVMSDIPNGKALAKCFQIDSDNKYTLNQRIGGITANDTVDGKYLYLKLDRNKYYLAFDSGTGQTNIRRQEILDCPIPLPPLSEQRAIAAALSDMDALIEAQEKLIAKKKAIKQGAMQELLRPKSSWKEQQLSAIGKSYGGLSGKTKEDFEDGDCPYIPFMNVMTNPIIDTNYFDYVQIKPAENQNKAEQGDLFFNGSSETPEEVGMCSVLLEEVKDLYLNSFCFGFRFHKEVDYDGLFMAYFFRSNYGRDKMFLLAQGATRFNLSKSNFLKLRIMLPPFIEQKRIARILSDMDSEIAQMEAQLDKYRNLKQGMMQELLTGKKRLIHDSGGSGIPQENN
jgi:type I restriction enzyme, S subunit